LTGAAFSFENDSYFEPGGKPNIGHAVVAIDPDALAGAERYYARVESLIEALLRDEDVRLPGSRRQQAAARAQAEGVALSDALHRELLALAG
jgi:(2R)-3-sulfolactate dehydrogenase (NADP+)